ncbi:hypothetical protein BGZ65_011270 [Modicella reniformis]|uniref:Uncharacterized protein n=1 Tax=Modicella reniformis TaxID=1440133 RepID=A0A9P6LTR8_9FUNG|nr:hypothetical protein BGZ65_011270 [Modicella reniformis]
MLSSVASLAFTGLVGLLSMAPRPAQADIICTQYGSDTFRIGSTVKFQWNNTESVSIESFKLDLYCSQNNKLVQAITTLNLTSPATVPWIVDSTLASGITDCPLNQFQGGFSWTTSNPDTNQQVLGVSKCKVMLFINPGAQSPVPGPGTPGNEDDDEPSEIIITEKTKNILIGVGSAFGALVLAGFVGFYYIRYSNKRAAEKEMSKKLREPIQTGPLFPPMDRSNGSSHGLGNGGRSARYNELASVTTGSLHSPAMTTKTEIGELGVPLRATTPIAAAHAKVGGQPSPSFGSTVVTDRPASLLTSSFVPSEERR